MKVLDRSFVLLLVVASSPAAWSQTLGPDFVDDYAVNNLHLVPGVPTPHGGMQFKDGDPDRLLIVGSAESGAAKIYEIDVTRDAQGHVNGFSGTATVFATTPQASAGLIYGPGGVLFYTTYPTNTLAQIKPGSTTADKVINLGALGVQSSTGGVAITPPGFPDAGSLKITSYNSDYWYDADIVPDGSGTFDVINVDERAYLNGSGPNAIEHVDTHYPAFGAQNVIVMEWWHETVSAYILDWNGDPIPSTRRLFLTNADDYEYLGSTTDQKTGDFLVADLGIGQVTVVRRIADELGTNYCTPAVPNSTGQPGAIAAFGQPIVSNNYCTLTAFRLPKNKLGYFLASQTQDFVANPGGSDGNLCLGGPIHRFEKQMLHSGEDRRFVTQVDLTALPVLVGETWNFQAWYRDVNPVPTSNFTDAVSVLFQ